MGILCVRILGVKLGVRKCARMVHFILLVLISKKKENDNKLVYIFLKTSRKSHGNGVIDLYAKKITKVDSTHTCLAVIALDSVLKKYDNYYPQVFLKECKYIEKKVIRQIIDDVKSSSDDCDEFDEE